MLFRSFILSVAAIAVGVVSANSQDKIVHVFDADYAGVDGTIVITYDKPGYSGATIRADLRFGSVDMKALKALDGNCTGDRVIEYKWHLHTKWDQPASHISSSAKFGECAKAITGDHYDPYKICGPASEYASSPECASKIKNYNCTPETYKKNFGACEIGDFSGKYGTIRPTRKGIYKDTWHESAFPSWYSVEPSWNIVLHAVCGTSAPRVACANSLQVPGDYHSQTSAGETDDEEVHVKVHVPKTNNGN